jgi:hypothetical protein
VERFKKQHTRSEKHRAAAMAAWGVPASLQDVEAVFAKFLSSQPCPFPWTEGPLGAVAATPQLQKMLSTGYLPINALAQVRPAVFHSCVSAADGRARCVCCHSTHRLLLRIWHIPISGNMHDA